MCLRLSYTGNRFHMSPSSNCVIHKSVDRNCPQINCLCANVVINSLVKRAAVALILGHGVSCIPFPIDVDLCHQDAPFENVWLLNQGFMTMTGCSRATCSRVGLFWLRVTRELRTGWPDCFGDGPNNQLFSVYM